MREIINDILEDPSEYGPALVFMSVLLSIWLGLSIIAAFSLRRAIMCRGRAWLTFCLAVIPLLCGFIGVLAEVPFSWKGRTVNVNWDLHWLFLLPLLLGGAGLVIWWRARQRNEAVA
jgi:fatty-acid desaturase